MSVIHKSNARFPRLKLKLKLARSDHARTSRQFEHEYRFTVHEYDRHVEMCITDRKPI